MKYRIKPLIKRNSETRNLDCERALLEMFFDFLTRGPG